MEASEVRKRIIHLGDKLVELRKIRYIKGFDNIRWHKSYDKIRNEILLLYEMVEDKENLTNDRKIQNVIKECMNLPRYKYDEEKFV